jgi:hypothetical protein
MEIPPDVEPTVMRFADYEGPALMALLGLVVMALSAQGGMSQRNVVDIAFKHLPNAEDEDSAKAAVIESCALVARDSALADDLLALAERWNAIVQAS